MPGPPAWKQLYQNVLMESDLRQLPERIQQAQTAIINRIDELLDDPERLPEHDEILQALNRLSQLEVSRR